MPDRSRTSGYSFCLITDGRRPEVLRDEVESIQALGLEHCEIIVVGNVPPDPGADVITIHAPELAFAGRLGAMRNRACVRARYDHLIVADDDMFFHPSFGAGLRNAGSNYDVLCVRLLNPDGTRFWDWATIGGPRGHMLLDYDDMDDHVYVTGGLAIMRASVHDQVPWDDAKGFYQGEDVEWSSRLHQAGARIRFTDQATVTHRDARYTQHGRVIQFRQDLSTAERLSPGVVGVGFFRPLDPGFRWMSGEGMLRADAQSSPGQALQFSVSSAALGLLDAPLTVTIAVNGAEPEVLVFNGRNTFTASLPLATNEPTVVVLRSDRGVPGTTVGVSDERPVSVLLHDVCVVRSDATTA